jgi:hypothetical protein
MNLGEQGILHEGEIGYFPKGQTYGPQEDPLGDPKQLQLVLQFGGASGLGMSAGRGREPASSRPEGERRRERRSIKFPRPRYESVVVMDPAHFNWLPLPDEVGVERKYLGSFTERGFWIEMIKTDAGVEWFSTCESARRLIVAQSGAATVEGRAHRAASRDPSRRRREASGQRHRGDGALHRRAVVVKREDGAGILRPQIAHAKAWGCLGVSGDRPENDEACAAAGVESVGLVADAG